MYSNNGRAVRVSPSDEVELSTEVQGASTFLLLACRLWKNVSEALRPRCVSLMDANRADWYVRHDDSYIIRIDPASQMDSLPQMENDSSWILHADTFYPGYYALESLSLPHWYIKSHDDCLLYTSPSPRDGLLSRMPSSA